ncbi:hypothetical protein BH10ACT1_BH10ACT1_25920 [soil metagenome]
MSTTPPADRRPPGLDIKGPRADVPAGAGAGDMPYAAAKGMRPVRGALLGAAALVAAGAVVGIVALTGGGSDGSRSAAASASTTSLRPSTSTTAATTTSSTSTTSTTAPVTTTTASRTANIPVDQLPRHEAVYRDGKLVLQGTVPSKEIRERFRQEAAAVIGPENVIVRYQIDPRVPVPTDGRVRVDEDFLFPSGSAVIDPKYEPLMQLAVTVLRLNPQARMVIIGYTDDRGSAARNEVLSGQRAQALRAYLVSQGVAIGRVDAVGRGPADPVAPNDTDAGRAQNRRIEVELLDLLKG